MKLFTSKLSAVLLSACMVLPVLSTSAAISSNNTAIAAETADPAISFDNEDQFFVYVGTYGQSTPQFRYIYPNAAGSYTADKVLWENAPTDIAYGDIYIAYGDAPMTQVYPAADDPANAHVTYYTLDDGAELSKAGNCSDIMEKKDLSVTSKTYDGSSHWSVRYMDAAGEEYYYGLSTYSSNLIVDPLDCEVGDVYTYALYNDYMVVPLAKKDSTVSYGIGVSQLPDKTEYHIGEELDLTGLRLNGSYTEGDLVACIMDEDYRNVPITVDASEFDNTKAGTYPIYVKYGDAKDSFTVDVIDDERASGDVNSDGEFGVSDVVLLQKWLLAVPDTHLANWKAADFCKDGKLNVFDLCLMKRELIRTTVTTYVEPDHRSTYGAPLYVVKDGLNLYLGPDGSYASIATLPEGTQLHELGYNDNNYNWLFTEYNGQYGWIRTYEDDNKTRTVEYLATTDKPVIYLYPEQETDVHVELELTEADLSTTYPKYNNGWDVVAYPDGTLLNKADGSHHKYLFWDAVNCRTRFDFSKGFCVAGSDTERFLKEKLSYMGLTEQEMNEFIVYWLPRMEHNAYNLISFQGDTYTNSAKLTITPTPDSECRIFMAYVPLDAAVEIEPQQLETFEREGFSVVEWGGVEIKSGKVG